MSAPDAPGAAPSPVSAFAPFRSAPFTILWVATVVSNTGTWMHEVGAGWLMTVLDPDPRLVSAVQAAATLPVFLLALPAGALADLVDRRRLLIAVNVVTVFAAAALAWMVRADAVGPVELVAFTLIFGASAALIAPAWQAIVPGLVPAPHLQPAIALNSMGINVSRAVGPAVAGLLIGAVGLHAPFAVNAAATAFIVAALVWWQPAPRPATARSAEGFGRAMDGGLRFAVNSPALRGTLVRAILFFAFASAYWAMLPLVARGLPGGGSTLYGVLLGALGVGAVGGALVLPRLRRAAGTEGLVNGGTLGTALAAAGFALAPVPAVAVAAALLAGLSWIAVLTSLNVSAQAALADWVRGRGLSVYLTVFFGSMAAGSVIWGQVAAYLSVQAALLIAGSGAVLVMPLARRFALTDGGSLDHTPSMHWPAPIRAEGTVAGGPVRIEIEYRVALSDSAAFRLSMDAVRRSRGRSGAQRWRLWQDAADPERFVETWEEADWAAHMRHHDRVSIADRDMQSRATNHHRGETPPAVRHYLAGPMVSAETQKETRR